MERARFPDVKGILEALQVATNGSLGKPVDLSRLPPEQISTERKYLFTENEEEMPVQQLEFGSRILTLHKEGLVRLKGGEKFAGVDEYFCFSGNGNQMVQRLRFGSNRPAQISTKLPRAPNTPDGHGQSNVSIRHEDIQKQRLALTAMMGVSQVSSHFVVGQSGDFWFVENPDGQLVEIALYKVGRAEPEATSPLRLIAEIAPWNYPPPELAVKILDDLEDMLGLKGKQITQSIAEMFR